MTTKTTKTDTEQERAEFEAWWSNRGLGVGTGKKAAWFAYQAGRAALQSQDREQIINAARAAMNESFEVGDEYGSIGIPSDRAAYLSLLLDEYDHARRVEGES